MNKSVLIGMSALALALGACGKKTPPADIPPAVDQSANPPGTATDDASTWSNFPAMQADLVAKAGSTPSTSERTNMTLDQQAQATLPRRRNGCWPIRRFGDRSKAMPTNAARANITLRWVSGGPMRPRNFLIANGVPEGRLTTISWGKERPVAVGSNEEAWAQNRRAVTVVVR